MGSLRSPHDWRSMRFTTFGINIRTLFDQVFGHSILVVDSSPVQWCNAFIIHIFGVSFPGLDHFLDVLERSDPSALHNILIERYARFSGTILNRSELNIFRSD